MNNIISDDLNDSLDDLIGGPAKTSKVPPADYKPATFEQPCPKCRGSGVWRGGRSSGACFKCNGTGKLTFKQAPEKRAAAKVARTARKQRTAAENLDAFKIAEPAIWSWMDGNTFGFAVAMVQAVEKYGHLTDGQQAACERMIAKRDAAKVAAETRVTEAKPVNMAAIEAAFARASAKLKRPRLTIAGITIYPAKADSKNAGSLYVRADGIYLGKITDGKLIRSRECTPEQEAKVIEASADPKEAAVRHGRLTGCCAICNRQLSDPDSIARGIGPICASNFGW